MKGLILLVAVLQLSLVSMAMAEQGDTNCRSGVQTNRSTDPAPAPAPAPAPVVDGTTR